VPDSDVAPRIHGVAPSETPRASAAPEPPRVDPLPIEPVVPDPSSTPVADLPLQDDRVRPSSTW
jgi:hypothetical protein